MPSLNTKDFKTLVSDAKLAIQANTTAVIRFTIGSIMLAWVEAQASVVMWLQYLILTVLSMVRASTSNGADLDSWMADFDVYRLPAIPAADTATFNRFTATGITTVPVGTSIMTQDGSKVYHVTADPTHPNYDVDLGGYVMGIGAFSVTAPIQATVAGSVGNAIAGEVNTLTSVIPNVDSVVNINDILSGIDTETDPAFRIRFISHIASLYRATMKAVSEAVLSTQVGLTSVIVENYTYAGAISSGFFYVVVDDGSGVPPGPLLALIQTNIDAVRPLCSKFEVHAPVVVLGNVIMSITVGSGDGSAERALVKAAITEYLNSSVLGVNRPYTALSPVAYAASANIVSVVPGYTLNGAAADLVVTKQQVIKAGSVEVY